MILKEFSGQLCLSLAEERFRQLYLESIRREPFFHPQQMSTDSL